MQKVGYFDAQIRETLVYKWGCLTYLPLWENVTNHYKKICIPHHFLYCISEKQCINLKQLYSLVPTNSHRFPLFYPLNTCFIS